jgi:hypothetical protein
MSRDTCRRPTCDNEPGEQDRDDYNARLFCSVQCEVKHDHIKDDARPEPERSEPADFGGGESTGVQDL